MSLHFGERLLDRQRSTVLWVAGLLAAIGASFVAGWSTFQHSKYAAAAGAIGLVAGLGLVDPLIFSLAALPATMVLVRSGGNGAGSSIAIADILIVLGTILALPTIRWDQARHLRATLVGVGAYEIALLLVVAAHPNRRDVLEGLHRLFVISGSLIAGWAVARSNRADTAVKAFVGIAAGIAVAAVGMSVRHGFKAAYLPLGYQKNAIGAYVWMALAIVQIRPRWAGFTARQVRWARAALFAGLVASQSKQSILALGAALALGMVRHASVRRDSRRFAVLLVPVTVAVYAIVSSQLHAKTGTFNSAVIREQVNASDIGIWRLDPLLGQGMRWFYLPQFSGDPEPTNILYEGLTDSGLLGVAAYALALAFVSRVLSKLPRDLGTLALALLLGRVMQGIFDSYWIGAENAVPWLVIGIAVGLADTLFRTPHRSSAGSAAAP